MRLGLAMLEALHGPTPETVKNIQNLVRVTEYRMSNTRDLLETAWRAHAIASLGLGDGPAALEAARKAFSFKPPVVSQVLDEEADRRLSETFVAAAWSASRR